MLMAPLGVRKNAEWSCASGDRWWLVRDSASKDANVIAGVDDVTLPGSAAIRRSLNPVAPATVAMDVLVRRRRRLRAAIATWPPVNVFHLDDYDRQVA